MLDFEFCINTGNAKAICCHQPKYGVHEEKIMSKQISDLEHNNWIRDYTRPWGALILLAAKPHQESCTNIDQFVWRLCVSYRALNGVTRSFAFPIPCCSDGIEDLGDSYGKLYFISLDAHSGYHQIRKRNATRKFWLSLPPMGIRNVLLICLFELKMYLPCIRSW